MILFFISLLAGVLTVLAPCTISLLPVIVGGTLSGGSNFKRVLRVTLSLGVSVILFTLVLKVSSLFINIPQSVWQNISGMIIFILGLLMVFPALWKKIPFLGKVSQSSNKLIAVGYQKQNFFGDILTGAALGPVFSSCSPTYFLILATVLPRSFSEGLVYLFAYTFGLCTALLIVTLAGQKLLEKFGVAADPQGMLKRGIGIIFLLLGIAIFVGYDRKLELAVANNIFDITKVERALLTSQRGGTLTIPSSVIRLQATTTNINVFSLSSTSPGVLTQKKEKATVQPKTQLAEDTSSRIARKARLYERAPEITSASGFINTEDKPITISEFKNKKVVLVDFWTYSCINCQRTLPYVKSWYEKYKDQGLEIISIHTPEFAFEKVKNNVETAAVGFGVKYPIVQDNDYGTWNAFSNSYWPRKYLIDVDGFIIYDHAGEGQYDETEKEIQKALMERAKILGETAKVNMSLTKGEGGAVGANSLETYFGLARS